jgi:hypothetical protein
MASAASLIDQLSGLNLKTECSLWPLVANCLRMGDDFAAVVNMNPTLVECRRIMHEYHGVREAIIGGLNELGIEQGGHGDPVSVVLRQGQAFTTEFIKHPAVLLATDTFVNDEAPDGFVFYALAEFAFCNFGVQFM